jgi:L-ascorbate metabolism protein UlaG (beta-lactamase superfamily)
VTRVTWLGHATVLIEVDGARLLTDPVLRPRVAHLRRHAAAVDAPGEVDAVLISHLHLDHLDLPTLRRVPAPLVVPRGGARFVRALGRPVRELAPGDSVRVGGAEVRAVHAEHDGRRLPWGTAAPALGFVAGGVYFAGDTELFAGMSSFGPLDVALVPIWGWGPTLGDGHMDPLQAADAVALMAPRVAVPIHWGTLLPVGGARRWGHLLRDPAEEFAAACARTAPDVRVEVLAPGGSLDI